METNLENVLINSYKPEMISYIESHPDDFNELIALALSKKPTYSKRAAWLLWSCIECNDKRLHKHIDEIIEILPTRKDDHLRELLIVLQKMDLNETQKGILFDLCINIWEKTSKKPSVRYNAFKILVQISKNHPDLKKEIKHLLEDHYLESLSPGARKSILRMFTQIDN